MEQLTDPQRPNPYAYALNNPLRYTDPHGKQLQVAVFVAAAIVLTAAILASSAWYFQEMHENPIGLDGLTQAVGQLIRTQRYEHVAETRAGHNGVAGPPVVERHMGRTGMVESARITYPNGSVKELNQERVKEYVPKTDPRAPPGTMQRVEFENHLPGGDIQARANPRGLY